jgi:transposase
MRFADAIYARFGIRYDPDHVGRIMHRLGLRERRHSRVQQPAAFTMPDLSISVPEITSSVA